MHQFPFDTKGTWNKVGEALDFLCGATYVAFCPKLIKGIFLLLAVRFLDKPSLFNTWSQMPVLNVSVTAESAAVCL